MPTILIGESKDIACAMEVSIQYICSVTLLVFDQCVVPLLVQWKLFLVDTLSRGCVDNFQGTNNSTLGLQYNTHSGPGGVQTKRVTLPLPPSPPLED